MPEKKVSILVVDSDKEIRTAFIDLLKGALEDLGAQREVDAVADGDDAYKKIVVFDYDIVITDVEIPGMNGLQLARAILGMRKDIKIMILSETETSQILEAIQKMIDANSDKIFFFRKGGLVVLRKVREILLSHAV
jgi:CheY-like chemotaxis protein